MASGEDGLEWPYWMSNTTSPDAGTSRTWASGGTKQSRWVIILSSGHEIRSDWLPRWRDGWADIEDVDGRNWRIRLEAMVGWHEGRRAPTALRGYIPLGILGGKNRWGVQEGVAQEGISLPSPCV